MAAAASGGGEEAVLQKALQSVAQSTGWTYSLLWRLCPSQGALVWAEGYYNGAIRTRKTTMVHHQSAGDEEEEEETAAGAGRAALRRSRQLKELYDSLSLAAAGDSGGAQQHQLPPADRRPTAALAPEDLTETEWFYLMCASYCFPPAVGLPGEAFARRVHVWLCGANKVDSTVFSRAILARSAGIQTIACIPVDNGVLEIGTTEKVEEDIYLIQYARSIFMDQHGAPIMPALSGHSASTPTTHINQQPFQSKMGNNTTGIAYFAECEKVRRVEKVGHLANVIFAECQTKHSAKDSSPSGIFLHSVKDSLCRVLSGRRNKPLGKDCQRKRHPRPLHSPSARRLPLGKGNSFAERQALG